MFAPTLALDSLFHYGPWLTLGLMAGIDGSRHEMSNGEHRNNRLLHRKRGQGRSPPRVLSMIVQASPVAAARTRTGSPEPEILDGSDRLGATGDSVSSRGIIEGELVASF